jgi:hypothetical protein
MAKGELRKRMFSLYNRKVNENYHFIQPKLLEDNYEYGDAYSKDLLGTARIEWQSGLGAIPRDPE